MGVGTLKPRRSARTKFCARNDGSNPAEPVSEAATPASMALSSSSSSTTLSTSSPTPPATSREEARSREKESLSALIDSAATGASSRKLVRGGTWAMSDPAPDRTTGGLRAAAAAAAAVAGKGASELTSLPPPLSPPPKEAPGSGCDGGTNREAAVTSFATSPGALSTICTNAWASPRSLIRASAFTNSGPSPTAMPPTPLIVQDAAGTVASPSSPSLSSSSSSSLSSTGRPAFTAAVAAATFRSARPWPSTSSSRRSSASKARPKGSVRETLRETWSGARPALSNAWFCCRTQLQKYSASLFSLALTRPAWALAVASLRSSSFIGCCF
mmetsp:Transcript_63180/g.124090  ORF Transcript_63180/g.124090 Transcript_63180/m.124090 type:complete len:329 (-) Transcript_63180:256-1242(-)